MNTTVNSRCLFFVVSLLLLYSGSGFFARGKSEGVKIQDRYNALAVPGVVLFSASASSAVPQDIVQTCNTELPRILVADGKLKPVSMQQWLFSSYGMRKAQNPFILMDAIKAERYSIPVQYIIKPYIFKGENSFALTMEVYSLNTYYPLDTFRFFTGPKDINTVIITCLDEVYSHLFAVPEKVPVVKKKVLVQPFKLDFLKLVTLRSGEFEFIATPFIAQKGVTLREGDDYFSRILSYVLSTTELYQVVQASDFTDFSNTAGGVSGYADYVITGKVQLSEHVCVLYVDVTDVRAGVVVVSLQYPLKKFSLKTVWDAYRLLSVPITEKIFDAEKFGVVPGIYASKKGFYRDNTFVGWDSVENMVLPQGMHSINTGTYYARSQSSKKSFFVTLDSFERVYVDREGEYVWNLLKK